MKKSANKTEKQEGLRLRMTTFSRRVKKRFRTTLLNREEYNNMEQVPYYNSEKTEHGRWIAKDRLMKEGQVFGIPVNRRPGEQDYRVLWDWESFEVMRILQFETIEVYVWELEEEEERMLYTELAFPMETLPQEIIASMIRNRVAEVAQQFQKEEEMRKKEREEIKNRNENYEKRDTSRDIVYDHRVQLPPEVKKLNRELLDKVKERLGLKTDYEAQTEAYRLALSVLNNSNQAA
jgi:hypothetical protein